MTQQNTNNSLQFGSGSDPKISPCVEDTCTCTPKVHLANYLGQRFVADSTCSSNKRCMYCIYTRSFTGAGCFKISESAQVQTESHKFFPAWIKLH